MALPNPGMDIDLSRTALVITDPQNDFLSPDGVAWGVVGDSVVENGTVEHIEQLLIAALFLLVRIGGALLVCVTAAWGAGRVASWALSGMATRGTRSGYRNRHPGR